MHNYEHNKLIERIKRLDEQPAEPESFSRWIKSEAHLDFLRKNARENEIAIYVSGEYTVIHTVVVPDDQLALLSQSDLLRLSLSPYTTVASYISGGGRGDLWIERGLGGTGFNSLDNAVQLIFGRTFEGWSGLGHDYYELHQEYAHLTGIHWRPEKQAYCRFNEHGDLEFVVSVTSREDKEGNIALVSFEWEPLEEYLVASEASLVRMFDFTLLRRSSFFGWSDEPEQKITEVPDFFYRQKLMSGYAAYTRGVQIIRPRRTRKAVFTSGWFRKKNKQYVEFIAYDWRNECVTKVSTDPAATTNYFQAKENSLPFELSPAFFKPEVLLKYKADRDKYAVGERNVSCRAAWALEAIDVNEAGQVHAYICYLRDLPFKEQLYWLSFNEQPKSSISERAFVNDFKGEFVNFVSPLRKVISTCKRWHHDKVTWWTLRNEKLLERVNTPFSSSRDEWAEAFMNLSKLVIEGFNTKAIRARLDAEQVPYEKGDKTITLLIWLDQSRGDKPVLCLFPSIKGSAAGVSQSMV